MIIIKSYTVKCDLSGTIFNGDFNSPLDAINAALAVGWKKFGAIIVCPDFVTNINITITNLQNIATQKTGASIASN